MNVQRWDPDWLDECHKPADDGSCVSYADHARIVAELERAHAAALAEEMQIHLDALSILRAEHAAAMMRAVWGERQQAAAPRTTTADDLIAWLHKRFEFEWDECDHGVYTSSAPHNGQPYAMCERIGTALYALIHDSGKEA